MGIGIARANGTRPITAHTFPHYVRMDCSDYERWHDKITFWASKRGWQTGSRNELRAALVAAGVAAHYKSYGRFVTDIDLRWLLIEPTNGDPEGDDDGNS